MVTTTIKFNNIDISNRILSFEISRTFGQAITNISMEAVKAIDSAIIPDVSQTIEIWRDATKVFSGFIEKVEPYGPKYTITGKDKITDLVRKEVTYSYDSGIDPSAGKISEIFKDLVTTWGGLNADAGSIQDSGTTITLNKFICNHADVFERCKALAETLDWQFYYRPDTDKVYFEPLGFTVNATPLRVGIEISKYPKWDFDNTEMMNDITIIGAQQLVDKTELFNGTGAQITFTLLSKPERTDVYVNGVQKKGGAPGATGTYDYYVDKERKTITFTAAPGVGVNNVEIRYSYGIPTPVVNYDQISIDAYGRYTKTLFLTDVKSVVDAENRLNNLLEKYKDPFVRVQPKVIPNPTSLNIQVGRKFEVIDDVNNYDEWVVVNSHTMKYPQPYDEADMGDKVWKLAEWGAKVEEKIQRLEEDATKTQDLLLHIVTLGEDYSYQLDRVQTWTRGFLSNVLLLGYPVAARRQTYNRLGPTRTAFTMVYEQVF
jgi:hypothetical protein